MINYIDTDMLFFEKNQKKSVTWSLSIFLDFKIKEHGYPINNFRET